MITRIGYPAMKLVVGPLVRGLWVGKVEGLENIPKEGACLVASNHESFLDFFCFTAVCDRKIHYLAAEKFFAHPIWKWVMRFMGCVRVDRYSNVNVKTYKEFSRLVRQQRLIGIFPEGTRSPDGQLLKARTGVAHLALKANLPVIPVGIRGTYEIMSVHDRYPSLEKATIHIGEPLRFSHLRAEPANESLLSGITDTIMLRIAELTGEEYRHAEAPLNGRKT